MFQILEITEIWSRKKNKSLPQLLLSFPIDIKPSKYFSGHTLKNIMRKQEFGYDKKCEIWIGNFYSSLVSYIPVDYRW